MANRDCNGDFYEINGKRWYRCLWDSTVSPAENCAGSCPQCERKIDAVDHGPVKTRQFIVTEVFYADRWYGHSTEDFRPSLSKNDHHGE